MQTKSPQLDEIIDRSVELRLSSRVVAEWEINSYYDYVFDISENVDEKLFASEDILRPRRPKSGLPKLYSGSGRITSPDSPLRYRIASEESRYKYYSSKEESNEFGQINFFSTIMYPEKAVMNRLVVGFENAYCLPLSVAISFMYEDGVWSDSENFAPDQSGLVVINRRARRWRQEDIVSNEYVGVYGIKIEVPTLSEPNRRLDLIQFSPRLAFDFSDRVITASVSKSRQETSIVNPIGRSQASTANITFSNDDRFFNPEDETSVLYNIIDKNVKFDVWFGVNTFPLLAPDENLNFEYIKQITIFSDDWNIGSDSTVTVEGRDRSKFFQEEMIENSFYTNKTAQEIVRDIVERGGVVDHDIRYSENDKNIRVPFVFFQDEKTIWEALDELAIAEQSVFYFDENDVFVWESRDYLWSDLGVDLTLRSQPDNGVLANLVDFSFEYEIGTNKIGVNWSPTDLAKAGGEIVNNVLWEEQGVVVLGATILQDTLDLDDEYFVINSEDVPFFPPKGIVNINGEYLSYEKYSEEEYQPEIDQSRYESEVSTLKIIERGLFNSTKEVHLSRPSSDIWSFYTIDYSQSPAKIVGNTASSRHFIKNSKLNIVVPEQNFRKVAHYEGGALDDSYGVYGCQLRFPLTVTGEQLPDYEGDGAAGIFINKPGEESGYYFEIITSPFAFRSEISEREARVWKFNNNGDPELLLGYIPEITELLNEDDFFKVAGSNIVIAPGEKYELTVAVSSLLLFAYLQEDLRKKSFIRDWESRKPNINEAYQAHLDLFFQFYEEWQNFIPTNVEEYEQHNQDLEDFVESWEASAPDPEQFYTDYIQELELFISESDTRIQENIDKNFYEMRFFVNGQQVLSLIDSDYREGRWGVFARSKTSVEFEYVYAIDRRGVETDIPSSATQIRDYINGGFRSDTLSSFLTQYNQLRSDVIIEDFGPWVQEVKEFDVDHEISPSISSNLFISAEGNVGKVYHYRDQFSSRFAIVNKTRSFIVVVGTDPSTGSSMKMFTYGVPVVQREKNTYKKEDKRSVWRRGVEEISIDSVFIQTEEQAERIADWTTQRWGRASDFISASMIINPAVQVGDLVALSIPEESIRPESHMYHINAIECSIGSSNEMSLKLKRAYF